MECCVDILRTRIIKFLKPAKEVGPDSRVRTEVRLAEWVAKTWRYFLELRIASVERLAVCSETLPRYTGADLVDMGDEGDEEVSEPVEVAVLVRVAMALN